MPLTWIKGIMSYETPHEGEGTRDPLYYTHARRVAWVGDHARLRRFNRQVLRITAYLSVPLVLLAIFVISVDPLALFTINMFLFLLTLLISLVIDFFCMLYGVNSIRQLNHDDTLEFIRVTTVSPTALMTARVRLARLYAWRPLFIFIGLRLLLGMLWLLSWFTALWQMVSAPQLQEQPMTLGILLCVPIPAIIFLLREPYWRYLALTEIGVRVAARLENDFRTWTRLLLRWLGMSAVVVILLWIQFFVSIFALGIASVVTISWDTSASIGYALLATAFGGVIGFSPLIFLEMLRVLLVDPARSSKLTLSGMALLGRSS